MSDSNPIQNNPAALPDALAIKKSAIILRAVNHKLRQQFVKLLLEKQSLTVTEIFTNLFLEQAVASQHLAVLRRAGFVKTKREGKLVRYSINLQRLQQVQQVIDTLL
jgi:DNA-binding transcriptional ArsR family regulator